MKKHYGFTLVELMITLTIAGILLTIGVPSFQNMIRNNRTVTNANNLVTALNLARSEAIKRGVPVTVKRKGTTSENWDSGWDVFTDIDADGVLDDDGGTPLCASGDDCLVRTYGPLSAGYTLRSGGNFDDWVVYLPSGLSRGSSNLPNDTFRLCDDSASTTTSRAIVVSVSGRPMMQTGTKLCP